MAHYRVNIVKSKVTGEYKVRPGIQFLDEGDTVRWFNRKPDASKDPAKISFPNGHPFTQDPSGESLNVGDSSATYYVRSGVSSNPPVRYAYKVSLTGIPKVHGQPCQSDPEFDV